jgi:hypothetical protein
MSHVAGAALPESETAEPTAAKDAERDAAASRLEGLEPTPGSALARDRAAGDHVFRAMGRLLRGEGDTFVVRPEAGSPFAEIRAGRAVSCLVEPELDDVVLVAAHARGPNLTTAYVLAVLERESPNAAISSKGDLEVRVKEGRFRVASQKGIDLVSPESVDVVSNRVGIHANVAKIVATEIVSLASQVVADLSRVKVDGSILDKVFDRVSERVQRSFREIEESEHVRAKEIEITADQSLTLRSENTIVAAKEVVELADDEDHYG